MHHRGVGSWPARRARSTPDSVAFVHDGRRQTYRDLHRRVGALGAGLAGELGVGRGDRVAYLGPNHPRFLETLFAVADIGAVFVPLNTRLAGPELAFMLDDSGARVLVHDPAHREHARELAAGRPGLTVVGADPGGAQGADRADYEGLLARHEGAEPASRPVDDGDDVIIMYTSGTTGRPKGARLTHGNLTWNAVNVLIDIDLGAADVTLLSAPLFHTAALGMTCLPTFLKGGTLVLEESFDVDRTLDLIESERVTFAFGVPTMFDAIARSPRWDGADLSSLRFLLCGGAPVPPDLLARYGGRGLTFLQGYGMTEAAPSVLLLAAADSVRKAGSAGRPAFFTDVRLDDVGPGNTDGARGEVVVSGPNVFRGYWNRPDADDPAFTDDGWFRSGDIATVDDDGYYRIVDRAKDMFISGGENVYPAEVEAVLRGHRAVADAAVIGVPDPVWGEVGHAVLVLDGGSGADLDRGSLREFLTSRLGKYKVPKHVTVVDALPRNPSGKLDKAALRSRHTAVS